MAHKSKYTYDMFKAAAEQSNDIKSRFIKDYRRLYEYAQKVGWYSSYPWKESNSTEQNNYIIYGYIDKENQTIYIGLTNNLKKRDYGHRHKGTVNEYYGKRPIPEPVILLDNLSAEEAKRQEGLYVNSYKEQGWKILNKAKTGVRSSSLGRNNEELTYDVCFELSKKYKTKATFQKGDVSAYRKALEMGWLQNWFSDMDRKKWTREKCYDAARNYKTRSEFRLKCQSAYNRAWRNNWLKDYYWFIKTTRKPKWDEEACLRIAKLCSSKTDLSKKSSGAYKAAKRNGWLTNYTWFTRTPELLSKKRKWTYEICRNIAQRYKTRWAFGKENSGAYHACLRNHWLDSFEWFS